MSAGRRVADTFRAMTTTLFRCPGLSCQSADADRLGLHDLAWWLVMIAAVGAWYFMMYEPQQQRLQMLNGRTNVLDAQLKAEQIELNRVQREIKALKSNDIRAWERAARAALGWLKPGEITDIQAWRQQQIEEGLPDPSPPPFARNSTYRRPPGSTHDYARHQPSE